MSLKENVNLSKTDKILQKILSGLSDRNLTFSEVLSLLISLGFTLRINGSHHIFTKEDIEEILNIQPKNGQAKAYQVKQVRDLIVKYALNKEPNE